MINKEKRTRSGQISVVLALVMLGLLGFAALAIDGGNAYLKRREAQNAADAAAISGAREMFRVFNMTRDISYIMLGGEEGDWLRISINDVAQRNGVPDSDDDPANEINTNIKAWYLDESYNQLEEVSGKPIPQNASGIEVKVTIPFRTFIAGLLGRPEMAATVDAAAKYIASRPTLTSAIWADGTCEKAMNLSGSFQYLIGGIHSNGDLSISGNAANPSYYSGTIEYAGDIDYNDQQVIFDSPPDDLPDNVRIKFLSELFDIKDYAPGGKRASEAEAAGMYYYYTDSMAKPYAKPGLHFSTNGFSLGPQFSGKPITITLVTPGQIKLQSDSLLYPYMDGLLMFSTYGNKRCPSNEVAINMPNSYFNWYGLIYAPNGHIKISASDNSSFYGSIVGWTVDLSGSQITVLYDQRYDPLSPPTVYLIW